MADYHRATAQATQDNNEASSQGYFSLSSMDQGSQYGHQTSQWTETQGGYVNSDAPYQAVSRNLGHLATTETMTPDSFYPCSTDSRLMTAVPAGNGDLTSGCANLPFGHDLSACHVLPCSASEPMALTQAQYYESEPSYINDFAMYSHPGTRDNVFSFMNTQDLATTWSSNGLLSPEDFVRSSLENTPSNISGTLPPSPVSMGSSDASPTPPTCTVLPAPMMDERRLSNVLPDDFPQEFSGVYNQDRPLYTHDEQPSDRTIKASKPHRPLLSAPLVKPPSPPYEEDLSPVESPESMESRSNEDRTHPYYQAKPKEDGLYHCPYTNVETCGHEPTKQKCAYDKYLDSHLKPYRCKAKDAPQCADAKFSSTACRLRHEREAHGLHGHGKMPHLCHYEGCERSSPDCGFPRRWNLYDHMKRVHAWTLSASDIDLNDEAPSTPPSEKKVPGEKRKKSKIGSVPMKKSRSNQSHSAVVKSRAQIQQEHDLRMTYQTWNNCRDRMQAAQQTLLPGDLDGYEKLSAIIAEMHTASVRYRRLQAGLAAAGVVEFA